ncbi:MAG: hypothetical protein EA341_16540 [Mongoliibacter sp.]|uniref:DUF6702 family protein n=1 Tax=Mongoliibacter sp. TaxID=2022438 RepID=UPI0012F46B01|nr:DUF6702 family protein [Mongoliibacter sp.]TVP44504.1 MAG: hypothetical protein EA341_16540 [Mongoliibacter sp.]
MQLNYILILFLGWKVFFHPFYISLTEIRYNQNQESIEIAQKIFWDDLEVALGDLYDTKVDFLNPSNKTALESMVKEYLKTHNEIIINGKKVEFEYLGYEIEEEAAWFYLEAKNVTEPKKVEIRNEVLLAHFEGQQNIINFYVDKRPKSLILYKGKEKGVLQF